jgi:hypothetical protein
MPWKAKARVNKPTQKERPGEKENHQKIRNVPGAMIGLGGMELLVRRTRAA